MILTRSERIISILETYCMLAYMGGRLMHWFMKLGIWKKTLVILLGIFFTAFVLCGFTSIYVYQSMEISAVKEIVGRVSEEKEKELQKYFKEIDNVAYNVGYSSWMQKIFVSEISKERLHSSIEEIKENMSSLSFLYAVVQLYYAELMKPGF